MAETLNPLGRISLPRTLLRALPGGAPADTLDLQSSALQALGSSKDVLEQAKCVLSSSDTRTLVSEIDGSFIDKNIKQPQEKRQGLNRKRARFSIKPVVSVELENIHTKLDIGHLADPEEFFSEIEKIEIADKELKKLRGHDSSELLEQKKVNGERKRRPGIIKRISSYKHSFGTCADNLEGHLSAKVKTVTSGQLEESFQPDSQDLDSNCFNALEEREGEGPLTGKENKVGTLLENLLSSFESLDDNDDPVALIQEQLQLKKINLNTIQLPVTPVALTKTLNVTAGEQKTDRLRLALGSPVHIRTPLASISLLHRQSSKKDKVNDPYSSSPSPANASCFDRFSRVDGMILESSVPTQEASAVEPSKFETHLPINDEPDVSLLGQRVDEAGQLDIDAVQPSHTTVNFQHKELASVPQGSEFCPEFCGLDVDEHSKGRDIGGNMSNNVLDQESRLEGSEILDDGSRSAAVTTIINGDAETTGSEQRENEELHNNPQVPLEKNSKGVGAHIKLKRTVEKRKSLAEAGTKFVSGLRRSTRNRIRPLEFWRGEKILYGRIHESLATVIGVKYSSPGHSSLKVKSYVSDDYADFLEKASLY